jgi:hypothetical protein
MRTSQTESSNILPPGTKVEIASVCANPGEDCVLDWSRTREGTVFGYEDGLYTMYLKGEGGLYSFAPRYIRPVEQHVTVTLIFQSVEEAQLWMGWHDGQGEQDYWTYAEDAKARQFTYNYATKTIIVEE